MSKYKPRSTGYSVQITLINHWGMDNETESMPILFKEAADALKYLYERDYFDYEDCGSYRMYDKGNGKAARLEIYQP